MCERGIDHYGINFTLISNTVDPVFLVDLSLKKWLSLLFISVTVDVKLVGPLFMTQLPAFFPGGRKDRQCRTQGLRGSLDTVSRKRGRSSRPQAGS